ncbi:putative RING finger protein [Rosellinia necatrix]|uniref:RING-type E3 ubiquitin transferase n=1 Tax=Rosellinia necatrix TaxID=77044 RepID=A0A1W2TFM5_ROSNE|nr:putative RING finger protein [Rosellinia necatrix]
MASRGRNLEPAEGRDIVYCHNCEHQWYQGEGTQPDACRRCRSDCVEVVRPGSDPRPDDGSADSEPDQDFHPFSRNRRHRQDSDSDPEESHIEEHHFHGHGGLFGQRTIYRSPGIPPFGPRPQDRPGRSDDIIRQFTEMMESFGPRGPSVVGRSGPETLFHDDHGPHVTYQSFHGPGFAGGVSRFTITTSSSAPRPQGPGQPEPRLGGDESFQRLLTDLLAFGAPPPLRRPNPLSRDLNPGDNGDTGSPEDASGPGGADRPPDMPTALHQLLAALLSPNGIHGDAVYSQEALDRIITNLMEANPQSNAPPPASENAIASLPKKKLNEEMLGPELKGECTICIQDVGVGDEVIVLPCKHWFHEECVSLWLKQHNSCPVCRAAIDGAAAGKPRTETTGSQNVPRATEPSSSSGPSLTERRRANLRHRGEERLDSIRNLQNPSNRTHSHRRNSNSPPSHGSSAHRSPRVRSPSPSSRSPNRSERSRDNRGSTGSGPLNWIRDRFSGR